MWVCIYEFRLFNRLQACIQCPVGLSAFPAVKRLQAHKPKILLGLRSRLTIQKLTEDILYSASYETLRLLLISVREN
jgi:hypothetical protein